MTLRVALDTNILAYAEGIGDEARCGMAVRLIEQLPTEQVLLPVQTLGELYRVLTCKAGRDAGETRAAILGWADCYAVADSTWTAYQSAFDLAADHGLQIWDALILSIAASNHCRLLLSEDFHQGFTWAGVTVVNPFLTPRSHLLTGVLADL